ncbi:inositol monophosphatase family protein [Phormidium sp. CCY1219]|uniref:inositol monophosphatase family protein n=1 Tax=Phormidium sp. CCY1219 TaxID=2886104 RepID=UPI002D1E6445|nr:inositol monophosphatase family protein [Phormidium sp. CCY1219]MEB3831706.1 inositol monophosphatase family protein [Phormidium sp. CCY1219]
MTDFWDKVLNFAETTAIKVGKDLMADFGQVQASEKPDGSLITQSDLWADRQIIEAIDARFPEHGILSEEAEHVFPDSEWCWVIDPLDGTTNFARRIPIWAVSMALCYRGTPVFGYVHVPPLSQSFHGFWYGNTGLTGPMGAFLNHRAIHSSEEELSVNHLFGFCSRSIRAYQHPFPCKIRMLGVASYNFLTVAAGFSIGGVEGTPKIWDIAAVWPIVKASGAIWQPLESQPLFPLKVGTNYEKRPFPTLVVARSEQLSVFQPLVECLRQD